MKTNSDTLYALNNYEVLGSTHRSLEEVQVRVLASIVGSATATAIGVSPTVAAHARSCLIAWSVQLLRCYYHQNIQKKINVKIDPIAATTKLKT